MKQGKRNLRGGHLPERYELLVGIPGQELPVTHLSNQSQVILGYATEETTEAERQAHRNEPQFKHGVTPSEVFDAFSVCLSLKKSNSVKKRKIPSPHMSLGGRWRGLDQGLDFLEEDFQFRLSLALSLVLSMGRAPAE